MNYTPEELKDIGAAAIALAENKPVEQKQRNEMHWGPLGHGSLFVDCRIANPWLYRPKPEPKTRPWSKPDDVPLDCWFRDIGDKAYGMRRLIHVDIAGIICGYGAPLLWDAIGRAEYSTDRKTWHKCEVAE